MCDILYYAILFTSSYIKIGTVHTVLGAVHNLRGKWGGGGLANIPQLSTGGVGGASEFPCGASVLGSRSKKGDPITAPSFMLPT